MPAATNQPRDHHYIPQGYMRGFAQVNNQVYVLDKNSGRIRPSSPKGVGYLKDFYTVDTIDEKDSPEIEETLGTIENTCLPIIRKLVEGADLSRSEHADLAMYIALQNGRTPHAKSKMDDVATIVLTNEVKQKLADAANNPALFKTLQEDFRQANPKAAPLTRDNVVEWVLKPGPLANIKIDRGTYVKQFFGNALPVADGLLRRKWEVWHTPRNGSFITSDNPVSLHLDRELGPHETLAILLPGAIRYFPLTGRACLVIPELPYTKGISHRTVSLVKARQVNRNIYDQAHKYVISGSERLLSSLS